MQRATLNLRKTSFFVLIVALTTFSFCFSAKAQLIIDKAYCGAAGSWRDVTLFLKNDIKDDKLAENIALPFYKFGGDPAPERIKQLIIDYHFNGRPFRLLVEEKFPNGFAIELPSSNAAAPGADPRATEIMENILADPALHSNPLSQHWDHYLVCFACFTSLIAMICVIFAMVQIRQLKAILKGTVIVKGS